MTGLSGEMSAGETTATRFSRDAQFNASAAGNVAGDTYSGTDTQQLMNQYESLFGPAGRDIKLDSQRNKRHQRWHLPDSLKGYNSFLTDRIDGLITDATNSPFTRNILPYFYLENPDAKIKWNVYSFDEGMASRVPYESAARVLTQTKSSQSGYAIRQGLAIAMEHNFLASEAGRQNFKHQLTQLVGSIQLTNDLDVHIALLQAQSYEKIVSEKYYGTERTLQRTGKHHCDMFGVYNKITNALDLLIEEARTKLKTWGSEPPTFLLCPSNLTLHLTMSPERTNYITNGPDGLKRLAQGPDLPSYRGLSIIHSQKFALEAGREPRNVLRRKVRVAEHYWLPHDEHRMGEYTYEFYDQSSDSYKNYTKAELVKKSGVETWFRQQWNAFDHTDNPNHEMTEFDFKKCDVLVLRPNIEHEMLSVIIGRGGTQELGSTFWGQTELACYDDAQHGIWGMSYKYHERAIVTNERNLVRLFDVAFDGYNGGMGCEVMQWSEDGVAEFRRDTESLDGPYRGKSMVVLAFPTIRLKDQYLTLKIQDAGGRGRRGRGGGGPPPGPEDPANNNLRLDLERVLRKVAGVNPLTWTRAERLLDTVLVDCKTEFAALWRCMHGDYMNGNPAINSFARWKATPMDVANTAHEVMISTEDGIGVNIVDVEGFHRHVGHINHLHGVATKPFETMESLFLFCIARVITVYMLHAVYSHHGREFDRCIHVNNLMDELLLNPGAVTAERVMNVVHQLQVATNVNCRSILEAMYYSGRQENGQMYWSWLEYFYSDENQALSSASVDIPNPLILPKMFSPDNDPQVFVDSESAIPISDSSQYDLARFLRSNMTKNTYAGDNEAYNHYKEQLETMFTAQVNISPGENIRANTTQLPTLSYHGNMKVKLGGAVVDEVKCIGHMGNSYPGMASVREGRGLQTMNAPPQIMHLQ